MTTKSAVGKANRAKGARAELAVVHWLRANGWPGAERAIATGHRSPVRDRADLGDITGTPGLVWQVTDLMNFDQPSRRAQRLLDTDTQRDAAHADYGVLVQRRRGTQDAGRWYAWLHLGDLVALGHGEEDPARWHSMYAPVRIDLIDLVPLLHRAGYGSRDPEVTL